MSWAIPLVGDDFDLEDLRYGWRDRTFTLPNATVDLNSSFPPLLLVTTTNRSVLLLKSRLS